MKEIRRLRLKFMCYHMLVVTAVIGITFFAVTVVMEKKLRTQGSQELSKAVSREDLTTRIPYFSIVVGDDGRVSPGGGDCFQFPEQELLEQMALMGMAGEKDTGILDGYHLRYLRVSHPAGYMIAFADTSYEEALRNGVLKYGGLACAGIWLGFFVLSYFFSRWAVKPVAQSIRMQKQFVADASHELKTPLTVIMANTELLQEAYKGMSPDGDRWLEHISQECREMRTLVESLLLLAKNDVHSVKREAFSLFSLSDLVMEKTLIFEPVFYQEGKRLNYQIDEGLRVRGNREQAGQLITVLLDNAVKYSVPNGRVEIRLEAASGNRVRLWVDSEGEEIPREIRTLIFKRFYRREDSRSCCGGYGLGLAIASEIAGRHKAGIGMEYREGMNCFYVLMRRK